MRLVAQLGRIERDILKHPVVTVAQFAAVAIFDGMQGLVDTFAVTRFVSFVVEPIEVGGSGQDKTLVLQQLLDKLRALSVRLLIVVIMVLLDIGEIFEKQHGQDVVLVDAGVDGASEGIAGRPDGVVNLLLVDALF